MAPKDLGNKHTCFKCQTKFYDLRKPVPLCPRCGADQRESPALKAPAHEKRARQAPRKPEPEVDPLDADAEEEVPAEEDEDEAVEDEDV
ncbi:MAG: TIGR02300 family protein [Deltaproteobacteria bacterium]